MKKSKRTWLLLAGVAALSATLLVPTVLSACSTTPNTENPGDTNNPGDGNDNNNGGGTGGNGNTDQETKPNKLAEELKKLNETSNASARKNIYTDYFKVVNTKAPSESSRLAQLDPPNLDKPTVTPLTTIIKKADFFGDLINMINSGLDVGNATQNGQISNSDLNTLITNLVNEKSNMGNVGKIPRTTESVDPTPGSIWSPNAFEFSDVSTATWTYVSQNKNTVYELFLTENVDFNFESTVEKVSVKVSNKVGSDKTRSRLVVTTKKDGSATGRTTGGSGGSTTPSVTYESKTYNFKSDVNFALPPSLFDDFTSYLEVFDANAKKLKNYLADATKKYKDLASDSAKGFASATTLWNQFVTQNEESLLKTMTTDLNTKRSKSKIFEWIKANVNEAASANGTTDTTLVGQLQKDLEAAKNVNLDLDTLLIKGQNADNNGINNTDSEEPDYTLIISFDAEESAGTPAVQKTATDATVSLDEKWYILNLKATGFEFENTVNQEFFGYQNASFVTKPKLKLDAKSSFASYKLISTGDQVNGNDLATVQKLKNVSLKNQNTSVDVSSLYDINGTGFTKFLSDLVINRQSESTKLTDNLLDLNANNSKKAVIAFKEYLKQDATAIQEELLKPNVLADLILDNIDVSNQAMYTDGDVSNTTVPGASGQSWRRKINNFISGDTGGTKKPTVTIKTTTDGEVAGTSHEQKLTAAADIVVKASSGWRIHWSRENTFSHVYIFLGTSDAGEQAIVSTNTTNTTDISVNQTGKSVTTTTHTAIDQLLANVKSKFSIVFQEGNKTSKDYRLHAFYMGQEKQQTATVEGGQTTENQINFPISLNALLANDSKFLNLLFKADDSTGGESQPEVIPNRILRKNKY